MKFQKDRVALVGGGSGDIGSTTALRLAEEGVKVVVHYSKNATRAEETAQKIIKEMGGNAIAIKADITDVEETQKLAQETIKAFGKLDILITTIAFPQSLFIPFVELTQEDINRQIDVEFKGILNLCKATVPFMMQQKYGRVVHLRTDAAKVGQLGETMVSGCAGGIVAFSKALARELTRYKITVNCVCTGPVDTKLLQRVRENSGEFARKMSEGMIKWIPMGRVAKPEEIAAMLVFLASDEASWVTGQAISVSGGLVMT